MIEKICDSIYKYRTTKHYDLCLLSSFCLAWLLIIYTGYAEISSLFSNKNLGLLEAFLFTQIDVLSFQRTGIEILPNNSWRSLQTDTLFDSSRYWYNLIYVALWFISLRLLLSKKLRTIYKGIDISSAYQSIDQFIEFLKERIKEEITGGENNSNDDNDTEDRDKTANTFSVEKDVNDSKSIATEGSKLDRYNPTFKECPFCCERILFAAIKCKHCGSDLTKEIQRQHNDNEILSDVSCPKCFSGNVVKSRGFWIWFFAIILIPAGLLLLLLPARRHCLDCDFKFKQ